MGKISLSKNEILPQDSYHLKTSYYWLLVERNQVLLPLRNFTKSIPDELVINADQTPSKFVATDNITIAAKGQKHISRTGSSDIRSITLTVCESLDGKSLPFQLIYKGKTQRLLPTVDFPDGFCLLYNGKYWSNEKEIVRLIEEILVTYIKKFKEEKGLPNDQKSLLISDAFKAQSAANVSDVLSKHRIDSVMVPKNMAHLLQPLDLITKARLKKIEKRAFSKYFSSSIGEALQEDPTRDVITIKVDLRFSVLTSL